MSFAARKRDALKRIDADLARAKTARAKARAAFARRAPETESRPYEAEEAARVARAACAVAASVWDLAPETLYRATRGGAFEAEARQVVYWLLHKPGRMSLEAAGQALKRDRSTVAHGVEAIEAALREAAGEDDGGAVGRFLDELADLFVRLAALQRETLGAMRGVR